MATKAKKRQELISARKRVKQPENGNITRSSAPVVDVIGKVYADHIEQWPISRFIPYARNPRKHLDPAIAQMAGSIQEYGFPIPMLARSDGEIVDGHLRLLGAQRAGKTDLPTINCDSWSPAQVKAFRIMSRTSTLWSDWDEELLSLEMKELQELDFDMKLTGFDEAELEKYLNGLEEEDEGAGANAPADAPAPIKALFDEAWVLVAQNWQHVGTKEFRWLSPDLTPGVAAWHFVNAKYCGGDYFRKLSLAFNPEQFFCVGNDCSIQSLLRRIAGKERAPLDRLKFSLKDKPQWHQLTTVALPMAGARMPLDFPAILARDLIQEYCPEGGAVLDPCHGWGGRCVGFLLSDHSATRYVGCDPSPIAHNGVQELYETLHPFSESEKETELHLVCFEDFKTKECFDFALTSPPYFDREKYDGDQTSFRRYPTLERWFMGFYQPLIEKTFQLLKPGCVFALQVGSQEFPLAEKAREFAQQAGFALEGSVEQVLPASATETSPEASESVLFFRKPNRNP